MRKFVFEWSFVILFFVFVKTWSDQHYHQKIAIAVFKKCCPLSRTNQKKSSQDHDLIPRRKSQQNTKINPLLQHSKNTYIHAQTHKHINTAKTHTDTHIHSHTNQHKHIHTHKAMCSFCVSYTKSQIIFDSTQMKEEKERKFTQKSRQNKKA